MLTSAQGQWWHSEKCAVSRVSVQESGELEKLEGPYCHLQIPLSIPKLCGTGLGACNKVGSPQCLPRQTSKSSDLQAVCEAAVSMCHWKSSGQHYALCRSIMQHFSVCLKESTLLLFCISLYFTSVICFKSRKYRVNIKHKFFSCTV